MKNALMAGGHRGQTPKLVSLITEGQILLSLLKIFLSPLKKESTLDDKNPVHASVPASYKALPGSCENAAIQSSKG